VCDAVTLRELLKAMAGQEVELAPEHYAPVADRDVLLRLQNNVKSRLLQGGRHDQALRVVETMLLLAPDLADLWQEAGLLNARLGNMKAGANALEQYIIRAPEGTARHQAAAVLQQLKSKLN
jgi:regulator of sirC expression with transglutaminase-like and TPR domain